MKKQFSVSALIACAGSGTRMKQLKKKDGTRVNKVFRAIGDVPVVAHTIHAFEQTACIDDIVLITREADIAELTQIVKDFGFAKVRSIVVGGDTRQKSVVNGLAEVQESDIVLIHDGARALVTPEIITRVYDALCQGGVAGVSAAVKVKDSIKRADENGIVKESVPREDLWNIQTPQGFFTEDITEFHRRAAQAGAVFTDDCMAAEFCGARVQLVEGDYTNIKITTEEDMAYAEFLITKELTI
ncbi:MAG: 2-C-methyl-D-erythritol 4-phosphate cytidylyltransferase [Clostridia bacterium]|nr:2-C-methyl-D-erythritol 4-phosphate cytidylyltransferase [Clostridia bacterium]